MHHQGDLGTFQVQPGPLSGATWALVRCNLGSCQVQLGHLSGAIWVLVRCNLGSCQVQHCVPVVLADLRHKLIYENQTGDIKL